VIGWSYDAAGNLLDDGTTSTTWDALNRLTVQGTTSNAYNGDGVLVGQIVGSTAITYTQDLASPLSQILSDGTNQYIYGADRLFGVASSARTWYLGDALGSVRQTFDDAGLVQQGLHYDAWGVPQGAAIAPFGYTGELQQGANVYLRARWYNAGTGTFGSRDPFAGMAEMPYSLHSYQYAYANPVSNTDPSGRAVATGNEQGHLSGCADGYIFDPTMYHATREGCIPIIRDVRPSRYPVDIGIVIGFNASCSLGSGSVNGGVEYVIDLYDFEADVFGNLGGGVAFGASASAYIGIVGGWSSYNPDDRGIKNYKGFAGGFGLSSSVSPLNVQGGLSKPSGGGQLWAVSLGGAVGESVTSKLDKPFGPALDKLKQVFPALPSFSANNYFTAEDASNFIKEHAHIDFSIGGTVKRFHTPNQHPTLQDAQNLSSYVLGLSAASPALLPFAAQVSLIAGYNALAWQEQDAWEERQRHATQ